jgi:uncharacterized protein YkwD
MTVTDTAPLGPDRARLRSTAAVVLVSVAALCASIAHPTSAFARGPGCARAHTVIWRTSRRSLQRAVACLINRERHAFGLPALHENARLNRSAQGWTNTMVSFRAFGHGADFASRISAVGFRWSSVGENIATGFATPASVVSAWMASTGHCQNILNPTYRAVGTGVDDRAVAGYSSRPGTWTNDFGLLMGQRPASEDWGPARGCPYG